MVTESAPIYRILFNQQDELCELYAEFISEEVLAGFIFAENLLFVESLAVTAVEPSNIDSLKVNQQLVKCCYIPMHNIVRIDEVTLRELETVTKSVGDNISQFPKRNIKPRSATEK